MDAKKRKRRSSVLLAGARIGLFRASLLLGSLLGGLMLIAIPEGGHRDRLFADNADGIDATVTGSVAKDGSSPTLLGAAAVRFDLGPCIMFPDGTQKGICR